MKVITAANLDFKDIVNYSVNQNKKVGIDTIIYDINNEMGNGIPFLLSELKHEEDKIKNEQKIIIGHSLFKPFLIKKTLIKYKEPVIWLDADAFAIQDISNVIDGTFDIAVTMREQTEKHVTYPLFSGFINAGVLFFDYTSKSLEFIDLWINEIKNTLYMSDQEAINRVILKFSELNEDCYNKIYTLNGIKAKILKTQEYNYYYYPKMPDKTVKIIHLKGNCRKNPDYLEWFTKNW